MNRLPYRQIHLDFHTSPLIPDVGADFDAAEFAGTLSEAKVQLINIFGKCHHGYSYYPSRVGPMHPALKFDMLGQMIEALHKKDIRCPVYTTVVYDEYAAATHPEWLQLDESGRSYGRGPFTAEGSAWKWLCLNNGYIDYLLAQLDEILDYEPDGLWFDINKYHTTGCCCENCIASMKRKGLDPTSMSDRAIHNTEVLRESMDRLSARVRSRRPEASIVFNGRQRIDERPWHSVRPELAYMTQFDIESLPSGPWGYNHFPVLSRYARVLGVEMVGMNGRFHKSWADFGGMKNRAALEFECFHMMALGAKVNIGDQLHPRGRLDRGVYRLIGEVFTQVEEKEPWCDGAVPAAEIGLMCANDGAIGQRQHPHTAHLEAAAQMLLEDGAQFDIIDWEVPLAGYRLVVFPDIVRFDPERAGKVRDYLDGGGKILLTGRSGLAPGENRFALELGFHCVGESAYTVTYLRVAEALGQGLLETDYASYERGLNIAADPDAEVLAQVVEPYFERNWEHFMSHQQTPPDKLTSYAGAVRRGNVIYFSDPLFISYKRHGNLVFKQLVSSAIDLLLGKRLVESDLPSTARVSVSDQANRRIVHMLHYPVERRAQIDIIQDVIPLYDRTVRVKCDFAPSKVYLAPSMEAADFRCGEGFVTAQVREIRGHQMLVLEK